MAILSFLGGVREVGGNKILIEHKGSRIMLDFGKSYKVWKRYFTPILRPGRRQGLKPYIATGMLPRLLNVYRRDLGSEDLGLWEGSDLGLDGVLLSHAHTDHSGMIFSLEPDIPIYCGRLCLSILEAMGEVGIGMESELVSFMGRERELHGFRSGEGFHIGEFEVEPVHVDHSIPGSYAYLIDMGDARLAYSGDLRLHGTSPGLTEEFLERARGFEPDLLIIEGTRVCEIDMVKEADVYERCLKVARGERGAVLVNFSVKDVDRLNTFIGIARELGRSLVISHKDAKIVERFSRDEKLGRKIPSPYSEPFLIYGEKGAKAGNLVSECEIREEPGRYMLLFDMYDMPKLFVIGLKGGLFINSLSEPFDEEGEFEYERLMNWLRLFGLRHFQSHSHGHADFLELSRMVKEIAPRLVIPIHTEHPEPFREIEGYEDRVRVVEPGEEIEI